MHEVLQLFFQTLLLSIRMEKLHLLFYLQRIDRFNIVIEFSRRLQFEPQTFAESLLFFFEVTLRSGRRLARLVQLAE